MAINAFTVISEFRFDVVGAVLGTDKLQKKVDGLSNSVDRAIQSVQGLGMGFIASFSGANAGILGVLGNAISMSDKFTQSQLSFVQIIDSNMAHLEGTIGDINAQMMLSRRVMNDIAQDARKFGLPATELLQMTKTLTAMLVPKGLAGDNFSTARSMSRNLMKSAPNLGIDPGFVQGQLLRAIEGSASMGDTLFRRLITEAPESFQQANVKDAKTFNTLKAAKRVDILNAALGKFANNAKILEMRANTISGAMQSLRDLFMSFNSVLRPLGDVIVPPLVEMLNMAIKIIDNQGREVIRSMARFLKPLLESPKETFMNLMSLKNLAGDVAKSAGLVSMIVAIAHLEEILAGFRGIPGLARIARPLSAIFDFFKRIPIIGNILKSIISMFNVGAITTFGGALKAVMLTIIRMAGAFSVLLIPIMGLSRAFERMKIESAMWLADNMGSIIDQFTRLKTALTIIFSPIMDMIKGWEELFFKMLGGTATLDSFKGILTDIADIAESVSGVFAKLYSAFRGIVAGLTALIMDSIKNVGTIIANAKAGKFTDLLAGTSNIGESFMEFGSNEFMKSMDRFKAPMLADDGTDTARVSNQVNNYDVTMNNAFKEVLQPDRIAFTIQDQLEKASRNRKASGPSTLAAQQAGAI